ncbi:hypothetical protein PUR59_07980 [Streptomyces sp. SP18ES09]|uniref:hypothetical protein n=1 Tax=Streptomyces sp. SP18ES09 TaxID=3002532 RepID=UPI002E77775B|nr:hypothetical protein [Streptomyces sp. SP18ES09]MEE1814949.1 hypothetical protein [Streptomyces sp. SP18ES09]
MTDGWNRYTAFAAKGSGLVARDKEGKLWFSEAAGWDGPSQMFPARELLGGGWNTYNLFASMGGDSYDLVARDASGVLWAYGPHYSPAHNPGPYGQRIRVGGGWNVYDAVVATKDFDGGPFVGDFLARDRNGRLWLYEGRQMDGGPDAPGPIRRQVGHGWGIYDVIL